MSISPLDDSCRTVECKAIKFCDVLYGVSPFSDSTLDVLNRDPTFEVYSCFKDDGECAV